MSTELLSPSLVVVVPEEAAPRSRVRRKLSALVALTKPRIIIMVLWTVASGYLLGSRGDVSWQALFCSLLGTGLVAGGASSWNMLLERHRDALMRRTCGRPLPTRRVNAVEAAVFGTFLTILGLTILWVGLPVMAFWVALATFLLYVFIYTPLKTVTTLNTAIGAIPGALPPVIGWASATGELSLGGWALFAIMYFWQFPHFLAIAWLYREDYARGGLKMLPQVDPTGLLTGRKAAICAFVLIPAGIFPAALGLAGSWYVIGASIAGCYYLACALEFSTDRTDSTARGLLKASFLHLPLLLLLLVLNPSR